MSDDVRVVTVDATNVDRERFFCYKSKPKSVGYQKKLSWLGQRFAEGMRIRILYEGKRSVGFIEYIPGEYAWRAVNAEGYMVIHCLWVVGKGKGKGYGSRLLNECIADARSLGQHGVAMVTSSSIWLADKKILLKNGFEVVGQAPPTFDLLVKRFDGDAPLPAFPEDWDERAGRYGSGVTVVYSDQCPYIEDAVKGAVEIASEGGAKARTIRLESSQQVRDSAPSAYGIFNVVYDGKLVTYHYIDNRKGREKFLALLQEEKIR
ncbi:MAG: GNAT family N-acetyltransferase [Chloroflexota bacterium]|nr:GNAT family N-acetyltransferase [Chloroflexota bacterium]